MKGYSVREIRFPWMIGKKKNIGVPYEKTHLFYKIYHTHFTDYILRRRYLIYIRRKPHN
jgi:hypothetical protein